MHRVNFARAIPLAAERAAYPYATKGKANGRHRLSVPHSGHCLILPVSRPRAAERRHRAAAPTLRRDPGPHRQRTATLDPHRRRRSAPVWYERDLATPLGLAARLNLVARRIEAVIIHTVFPEMTARLPPLMLTLDSDPGDASYRVAVADLNSAFDRFAPGIDTLTAADLGLHHGSDLRAA